MNALYKFSIAELKLCMRDKTNSFFSLIVPVAMYMFFGTMYKNTSYGPEGLSYFDSYTPAMIAIVIMISALFSLSLPFVQQKEGGVFKRFLATPLPAYVLVTSSLIKGVVLVSFGVIEMFVVGYFLFDREPTSHLLQFGLAFFISSLAFFAFAFLIAAFFKKMQAALAFNFVLFYPMMFLSGATFPLDSLPESLQFASHFIPLTYVVQALQHGWNGDLFTGAGMTALAVVSVMGAVSAVIASKFFKWMD